MAQREVDVCRTILEDKCREHFPHGDAPRFV
jgi:hypothetical protein